MRRRRKKESEKSCCLTTSSRRRPPGDVKAAVRLAASCLLLALLCVAGTSLYRGITYHSTTAAAGNAHADLDSSVTAGSPKLTAASHSLLRRIVGAHAVPAVPAKPAVPLTVTLSKEALDMCTRTLWHTLETTTIVLPNAETFVHTGDIDDLWLRDSAAQIHPLLLPLMQPSQHDGITTTTTTAARPVALIYDDPRLDRVVAGLIARHALYIRHDPYANAFRVDNTYVFNAEQRRMGRHDLISTWNYELDSACYTIRMVYYYWKQSRNPAPAILENPAVQEAVDIMVDLWIAEQQHELDHYPTGPLFDCVNCNKPYRYQTELPREGKGSATNASAGLTWTGFRPSDDACQYGYLVPANMFAAAVLEYVKELSKQVWNSNDLYQKAAKLQADIRRGIEEHAIVQHPIYGKIYAYEVDGLGNSLLMDDANVPSLLSIPYLEYPYMDAEIYANTRRFILSTDNPTFSQGTNTLMTGPVAGIGSPHMAARIPNNIWPMALAMEALTLTATTTTPDTVDRKVQLVEQLVQASAGTGWMHESFDVANPHTFTRSWFCWADSLFAELVLRLLHETTTGQQQQQRCPDPSHQYSILEWRDPVNVEGGIYAAVAAKS